MNLGYYHNYSKLCVVMPGLRGGLGRYRLKGGGGIGGECLVEVQGGGTGSKLEVRKESAQGKPTQLYLSYSTSKPSTKHGVGACTVH